MNADWLEILWTLIALTGLGVAMYGIHSAQVQIKVARGAATNGAARMVAGSARRREALRGTVQLLYSLAGIGAMLSPPAPQEMTTSRAVIIAFLIVGSLVVVVNSALDQRFRIRLVRYLAENLSPPHGTPKVP